VVKSLFDIRQTETYGCHIRNNKHQCHIPKPVNFPFGISNSLIQGFVAGFGHFMHLAVHEKHRALV